MGAVSLWTRPLKKSTPQLLRPTAEIGQPTSMNCMRTSTMGNCCCTQRACERPRPKYGCNCGISTVSRRPEPNCWTCTSNVDHFSLYCTWRITMTMGNCLSAMTGMSTTNNGLQLRTPQFAVRETRIDLRIRKSSFHVRKRRNSSKNPRKLMPNMYPLSNQEVQHTPKANTSLHMPLPVKSPSGP